MSDYQEFQGTMPVTEAARFDVPALERYLRDHVADFAGPVTVEQFKGGQSNPTFRLTAPSGQYVLRRKPPGKLLPSAHAVDREYQVMTALAATEVPVPRTRCLCEDPSVLGTAFYIMDFVPGRVLWDPALPGFAPEGRAAVFAEMNRVIAALHRVDHASVGLGILRQAGQLLRSPDRPLEQAVPRLRDRGHRGHGPPHRLAAGEHPSRRGHRRRPRRLPPRQHDLEPHRAQRSSPCSTGSCPLWVTPWPISPTT